MPSASLRRIGVTSAPAMLIHRLFPKEGKRENKRNRGKSGGLTPKPRNPDFFYLLGGFRGRRYPRGFPDPVGWILAEYGIKRSHGDLIQTIFHVFGLKNLVLSSLCTRHREADAGRAGPADSRKVWACWFSSPLIFTHPRLLPCRCRGTIVLV